MARNPFSRTVTTKVDDMAALRQAAAERARRDDPEAPAGGSSGGSSAATPTGAAVGGAAAAGTLVREKDDELQQVSSDSDGGHAEDTPAVLHDNEGKATTGLDFGDFERLEKVVDAPDDGSEQGVEKGPRSRADELGIGGTASFGDGGGSGGSGNAFPGGSVQDELAAASGNQSPGIDLTGELSVAAAQAAKTGGERLFDLQTQSGDLAIAEAGAVATEPSVAITFADVGKALDTVSGVISAGVAVAGIGGASPAAIAGSIGLAAGEAVGGVAGGGLTAGGLVAGVAAGTVAGVAIAGATGYAFGTLLVKSGAADFSDAIDASVSAGEETKEETEAKAAQARKEAAARKAEAEKNAADEAAAKKAAEDAAKADPAPATSVPASDTPRSKEQFELHQKIKAELGYVHFPGDIDPVDGDGTTGGTPLANGGSALHQQGKEGLIGNPADTKPVAGAGGAGIGSTPGFGGSDQGGDIDFEDGSGFTGGTRTEDLPDFNVGGAPLVGLPPPEEEEEDTSAASPFSLFRQRGGKDPDDND